MEHRKWASLAGIITEDVSEQANRERSSVKAALKKMQYAQAAPLDENYGPQAWLSKEKYHG